MASSSSGSFDRVRDLIRSQLITRALPSLAVAVGHNGAIVWEEGFDWADRANRIPATPHTLYSLASISKPITTTGLADKNSLAGHTGEHLRGSLSC